MKKTVTSGVHEVHVLRVLFARDGQLTLLSVVAQKPRS
jgi:hypothetical protein